MDKKERKSKLEDLDVEGVKELLRKWEMTEFVEYVEEKQVDGRNLLEVTEGVVKLWRPKANAKKFIEFIARAKLQANEYLELETKDSKFEANPNKYPKQTKDDKMSVKFNSQMCPKVELNETKQNRNRTEDYKETKDNTSKSEANVEAQYQTVVNKKAREQIAVTSAASTAVEDILKKIVPANSFLYRYRTQTNKCDKPVTSYLPMDAGTPKRKRFFRLSSQEYPYFDIKQFRFSKTNEFNDRGYYCVKTNKYYSQKVSKKFETRTKYKTFSTPEDLEKYPEEHFYEDLNYNDMNKEQNDIKELKPAIGNVKPTMSKIQELFSSFKLPFFKKTEELEGDRKLEVNKANESESDGHIYENSESVASMYDSIHICAQEEEKNQSTVPVEDYLEPVQLQKDKDYCDVATRAKDETILSYILNLFENFSLRRETTDAIDSDPGPPKVPVEDKPRSSMADRPLPVPVENEPYFMDIDRTEAENLLRGQPDGTFILRPSSQPDHAYTLTVSCSNAVHNVGVRRRPDGRLALGYARRAERSFDSVTSLLQHHKKQRLLLVAGGAVCGTTALLNAPQYYQTPAELPRPVLEPPKGFM